MPNSSAEDEDWLAEHADWDEVEGEDSEEPNPFPHLPWFPEVVRQSQAVLDAQRLAEEALQKRMGEMVQHHRQLFPNSGILNSVIIRNDEKI